MPTDTGGDARRYREVLARWPELDHATGAAEVFLVDVLSQRDRSKADEEALGLLDRFLFSRIPTPKELPLMPRSPSCQSDQWVWPRGLYGNAGHSTVPDATVPRSRTQGEVDR